MNVTNTQVAVPNHCQPGPSTQSPSPVKSPVHQLQVFMTIFLSLSPFLPPPSLSLSPVCLSVTDISPSLSLSPLSEALCHISHCNYCHPPSLLSLLSLCYYCLSKLPLSFSVSLSITLSHNCLSVTSLSLSLSLCCSRSPFISLSPLSSLCLSLSVSFSSHLSVTLPI